MKYYLIAGEASGDLHGSRLVKAIRVQDSAADIRAWGGDGMAGAGAEVVKHIRDLAFMGFLEVVMNLRTILTNIKWCKADILAYKPDVLVLIDYPGFNLRMAAWAKSQGIRVVYYIAPQVWAWKENRVTAMKRTIDRMLVILPFEQAYFKERWQWDVTYVGHPLVEAIREFEPKLASLSTKPLIAVLPGSRKQEIQAKLPVMLAAASRFTDYTVVVAKAPAIDDAFYTDLLKPFPNAVSVKNLTYELLSQARAALVTSGTATLETALFRVPQAVCYKANPISFHIARRLIKIKYISLVNLIADKPSVREFIQDDMNETKLAEELNVLLEAGKYRQQMLDDYEALYQQLAGNGSSSTLAAEIVVAEAGR
jgi:lipid-A-disaccharide synthase